jgi:hypothetical protein
MIFFFFFFFFFRETSKELSSGKIHSSSEGAKRKPKQSVKKHVVDLKQFPSRSLSDSSAPQFGLGFEVVDYVMLQRANPVDASAAFACVELHVDHTGNKYKVRVHVTEGNTLDSTSHTKSARFATDMRDGLALYESVQALYLKNAYKKLRITLNASVGTAELHAQWFSATSTSSALPLPVRDVLAYVYQEAKQRVGSTIASPLGSVSLPQIQEAEAILGLIQRVLECSIDKMPDRHSRLAALSAEFYSSLTHAPGVPTPIFTTHTLLAEALELCQSLRDLCAVGESTSVSGATNHIRPTLSLIVH